MKPKVPNPTERDQAMYFNKTDEGGIRCVAAAWSIDSQTHVIVCAPDIVTLKRAWSKFTKDELIVKKAPVVIYKYEPKEENYCQPINEKLNPQSYYWYYNADRNDCFVEFYDFKKCEATQLLGKAERLSVNECKLLLRNLGFDRSKIDKTIIYTTDPIPF